MTPERMDGFTIAVASGMRARMESLDMLANNLANQGSPGYKADREFYSLYVSPEALESVDASVLPTPPTAPVIESRWTDFSQGTLAETGGALHVGLSGPGFFRILGPNGPLLTRNGNFRLSTAGQLQTQEGYPVLGRDGKPIVLDGKQSIKINTTGEVRQGGTEIAQLDIVTVKQPQALAKRSGTYFQMDDGGGAAPANALVYQGRLETANHSPADAAVRLITVLRQFEMLQKAVQISGEMNRKVEELARVSGG